MTRAASQSKAAFNYVLVLATLLILGLSGVALGYMWVESRSAEMPAPAALSIEEISFRRELERNLINVYARNTGSTNTTVIGVAVNNRSMTYAQGIATSGLYAVGNLSAGDRWTVNSVRSIWGVEVNLASRARYSEIKPGELLEIKVSFGEQGWKSGMEYVVRVEGAGGVWDETRATPG